MEKQIKSNENLPPDKPSSAEENITSASKSKTRGRKRKRQDSENSLEDALPENALEVEKNLQSAALKNNLDDVSVKKILKKVVTNDHVLALVKLREEEEIALNKEQNPKPKLTRAKAKELMKVSPKSAPWSLELTPIKHIPVKTRPEVEALISKDLPDDEDDDEYKPTPDDVPSDDDQTLESCSDADSLPATPGTPRALRASPRPALDGPFKVPQPTASLSARRKLVIEEEEATIALRTRSKLCLSDTPIEHIESSFVPPDDEPMPIGDDDVAYDEFVVGCLNPAETSKHEDDDEADPEYNAAADHDGNDDDQDINGLLWISKKELNDLMTELFSIMPADDQLAEKLATNVLEDNAAIPTVPWEGKQETISDEEIEKQAQSCNPTEQKKRNDSIRFSIGKSEPEDEDNETLKENADKENNENVPVVKTNDSCGYRAPPVVRMLVSEQALNVAPGGEREGAEADAPLLLRALSARADDATTTTHTVKVDHTVKILPEQILILQQQLRQHVQLAAGNFLQLYVNPAHWKFAPRYREYLEQLQEMVDKNPKSVAGVCNLQPALELVESWTTTVSEDTPANKQMVEFIQSEAERSRRRFVQNCLYVGNFPEMFMEVVANSSVFLYPYLLPAMPYRADYSRKFGYRLPEDELIALGLDQFWQYIEDNPELYKKPRSHRAGRWGLVAACGLLAKHMMPWMTSNWLMRHIMRNRKLKDNPIAKFFHNREVTKVEHRLLPFNPKLTLYEQPAHEMPKIWIRYLAKTSKRFKYHYFKRSGTGLPPQGVPVAAGVKEPIKKPLPPDFTKTIVCHRQNLKPVLPHISQDKFDLVLANGRAAPMLTVNPITSTNAGNVVTAAKPVAMDITRSDSVPKGKVAIPNITQKAGNLIPVPQTRTIVPNMYSLVTTSLGSYLVPLTILQNTSTVNSITKPISSSAVENNAPEKEVRSIADHSVPRSSETPSTAEQVTRTEDKNVHCECCVLLKRICKEKQSRITDFFKKRIPDDKPCECTNRKFPKITKRLRMLVDNYKSRSWCEQRRIRTMLAAAAGNHEREHTEAGEEWNIQDIEYVTTYHMKLTRRSALARNAYLKTRIQHVFSNFEPDDGDVALLSKQLFDALGVELVDLHNEFMGFLTPRQADEIDRFKDYFIHSCIGDLVKRIESEVQEKESRDAVLLQLDGMFSDNVSTSCALCVGILLTLEGQPQLARYVFSLFPHRTIKDKEKKDRCYIYNGPDKSPPTPTAANQQPVSVSNEDRSREDAEAETLRTRLEEAEPVENLNICEDTLVVMDFESENSSDEGKQLSIAEQESESNITAEQETGNIKHEDSVTRDQVDDKTVSHDTSSSSVMSRLVMSEDEQETTIKSEPPEPSQWVREEDIFIINLVSGCLTENNKGQSIQEILDENKVYDKISDEFPHKNLDDIKERVIRVVNILVLSSFKKSS